MWVFQTQEKTQTEARTGRTNCVYLVCPIYYYVQGQSTRTEEGGDPHTSRAGQPTGAQSAHKHPSVA